MTETGGFESRDTMALMPFYPNVPNESPSKSCESLQAIKSTLLTNSLFQSMSPSCINHIAEKMEPEELSRGEYILHEGNQGAKLYIIEDGFVQVIRNGNHICYLGPGSLFGELCLLYGWQHAVSFKSESPQCRLWSLDEATLQRILREGWNRDSYVNFMASLPVSKHIPNFKLIRLSWQIMEQEFKNGEYIIRQGSQATHFFVIRRGQVKVTVQENSGAEKFVRVLQPGDFFGEKTLLSQLQLEDHPSYDEHRNSNTTMATTSSKGVRTANVIVDSSTGVSCLVIDREAFYKFFRGLDWRIALPY